MKHTCLLLAPLLALLFSNASTGQTAYYWVGKERIVLQPDSAAYVFISENAKDASSKAALVKYLAESKTFGEPADLSPEILVASLLPSAKGRTLSTTVQSLRSQNLRAKLTVGYRHLGKPVYATDQIAVKPKLGVPISQIMERYKEELTQVEAPYLNGAYLLRVRTMSLLFDIANQIHDSGLAEWSEPNLISSFERNQTTDPLFPQQYYLNQTNNMDINAAEAWQVSTGNANIRVAVIDDGVEANHEDMGVRVLNGFDARINSYPPDRPADIDARLGHGQACAGIIAASHNTIGIRGIAPAVQIVPVRIFGSISYTEVIAYSDAEIATSINWAWSPNGGNADVLSNSWGGNTPNNLITDAINAARTQGRMRNGVALGCIVVASSGNGRSGPAVEYPASLPGVLTVGAIDRNGAIQNYSCRGPEMDLVAPSGLTGDQGDVWTTDRMGTNGYVNGNYTGTFGGTSAAAPQASGVAALILSVNPHLTESQVRTILNETATDMGTAGFDNTFGHGRLNAHAALLRIGNITGPDVLCGGFQSYLFNGPSSPGATVTWRTSSNISPTSGSGAQASIRDAGTGPGWIEYTLNYNNGSPALVFRRNLSRVGQTLLPGTWWCNGCTSTQPSPITTVQYLSAPAYMTSVSVHITVSDPTAQVQAGSWQWTYTGGTVAGFSWSGNGATLVLARNQGATITASALVLCGGAYVRVARTFSFGLGGSGSFAVFPNPATDEVTVADLQAAGGSEESGGEGAAAVSAGSPSVSELDTRSVFEVEVFTPMQERVRTATGREGMARLPLQGLRNGVYIVRVRKGGEVYVEQLVIAR